MRALVITTLFVSLAALGLAGYAVSRDSNEVDCAYGSANGLSYAYCARGHKPDESKCPR